MFNRFQLSRPACIRLFSTAAVETPPQRALLYVPSSDSKKLSKSITSNADVVILDLEDSVASHQKEKARGMAFRALEEAASLNITGRRYVRINSGPFAESDLKEVLKSNRLDGIVIPKVNRPADIHLVEECIQKYSQSTKKLAIVASIESPSALINLKEIATCSPLIDSLLFAAEDYCASSNILRTRSLSELLYARSAIVAHAKAFGLRAIDLVCVNYKDFGILEEECLDGRRLGFDGKQAIHPAQVDIIHQSFLPTPKELERAMAILAQYEKSSQAGQGAYGLTDDSGTAMIDAPMLLQARSIIAQAKAGARQTDK